MTTPENVLAPLASLALPDGGALSESAARALKFAQEYTIASQEEFDLIADDLRATKSRIAALEAKRTAITGPLNAALKAVNDLFRVPASLLAQTEGVFKSKMLAWNAEQERVANEARRVAEAEAAMARAKLEEQARAQAAEAEAAAKRLAEASAAGNAQITEIAHAELLRRQAEVAATVDAAQMTVAMPVAAPARTAGISTTSRVDFEITSALLLVQHVAEHPELINLVQADTVKVRAYVKGLGMSCRLPGVRVFEAKSLSARSA